MWNTCAKRSAGYRSIVDNTFSILSVLSTASLFSFTFCVTDGENPKPYSAVIFCRDGFGGNPGELRISHAGVHLDTFQPGDFAFDLGLRVRGADLVFSAFRFAQSNPVLLADMVNAHGFIAALAYVVRAGIDVSRFVELTVTLPRSPFHE